jgi:large subunit ribosomal protein L16
LTAKQLESCRRTLRRTLGKTAKIWLRPFTSIPVSSKGIASRMGKGKGAVSHWIAVVRQGKILIEVGCSRSSWAYLALLKASSKLPIKTKVLDLKF